MSCNYGINEERFFEDVEFQSLSGFLMSCNTVGADIVRSADVEFQSLSGFLMSCNIVGDADRELNIRVSIPIGFSNEL